MSTKFKHGKAKSRYGLPKNIVFTDRPVGMPPAVEPWLAARDDFDGMLLDSLDALEAGLIERRTFELEKSRLGIARRKADVRFERALRSAKDPRHPRRRR